MIAFEIRQEPGPQARARAGRYGTAPTKLVGTSRASDEPAALLGFILDRYPPGHKQFLCHRLEWQSASAWGDRWNADDRRHGQSGRRWRAVVSLANGRYAHDIVLLAWRAS